MFDIIFRKIQKLGAPIQIVNVVTDYERGIISAIETNFPEWHHFGCYFHYTQAIYHKNQQLGLSQAYKNNPLVIMIFRKFMSVAFVPLDQVLNCLQDLVQDSQSAFLVRQYPAIADFLFYFRRTWIDTFDPKMWNVFERPANVRTTNDLEVWNNAWGRTTRRASPNICLAVKFLCQQEKLVENVLLNLENGNRPRHQKRKWRLKNERIEAMKRSFILGNRDLLNYWTSMAHLCNAG